MNDERWEDILSRIEDAWFRKVDRTEMEAFLNRTFTEVLDTLEKLVLEGIDLADREVVDGLNKLKLALNQIPPQRVWTSDSSTVIENFDKYVVRFHKLLSIPGQDAETSFSGPWVTGQFDATAEKITDLRDSLNSLDDEILIIEAFSDWPDRIVKNFRKRVSPVFDSVDPKDSAPLRTVILEMLRKTVDYRGKEITREMRKRENRKEELEQQMDSIVERLETNLSEHYLPICRNLTGTDTLPGSGSDGVKASLADAAENLADVLTSEGYLREAAPVWALVKDLFSQDNPRIIQREDRLPLIEETLSWVAESYPDLFPPL